MFRWYHCFLSSLATVNINALNGIVEVDGIFFHESFKWKRYISYKKA
ncbi:MAG: hypothetical protein ACTS73_02810 [Arsenophonus sp. NEOnobi-MAG3]